MAADPEAIEIEGYTLGKFLGKGKFSKVYKIRRESDGAEFALKAIRIGGVGLDGCIEDKSEYRHEVELLQSLSHPNIIKLEACFEQQVGDAVYLYILTELAEIGDLDKLIKKARRRGKPLVEKTIWKLFFQIAAGLKHMHSQHIMHRDLKPANVFVGSGGRCKLGDVGLGRVLSTLSVAETLLGTPYYMSPERINEIPYDFKSDIWSLGCMLYEMAALQNPFYAEGLRLVTLCEKIDRCDYPPLDPLYSDTLRDLVSSIIVTDPDARPDINQVYDIAKAKVQSYM